MTKIRAFNVVFDKPKAVFMPGEWVTGRALLILNQPIEVNGVLLEFRGEARVGWQETETYQQRDADGSLNTRSRTVYYRAARDYVNTALRVFGKGQLMMGGGLQSNVMIMGPYASQQAMTMMMPMSAGGMQADYVWPFQFQLPMGIPSSFDGQYGSIQYFIKAVVEKSAFFSINYRVSTFFNVIGLEDCNMPQYRIPLQIEEQKRTCCWCCASDPIRMEIRIDRQAYTPLETIPVFANFDNRTSREIEPRVELLQRVTYRAHRGYANNYEDYFGYNYAHTRVERHRICHMNGNKIAPNSSDAWSPLQLRIPIVAPTIRSYDILTVEYELKVTVHVPWGNDMHGTFPITIGTIPWQGQSAVGFAASTQSVMTNVPTAPLDNSNPPPFNSEFSKGDINVPLPYPTGDAMAATNGGNMRASATAPPAYWDLFPKPHLPQTDESHS